MPILTKYSCDYGGCHGKATGQNGFRLSLFGTDASESYRAIVIEAKGRRVFPGSPENSLLLKKATGQTAHGGGKRFDMNSSAFLVLSAWIQDGMPGPDKNGVHLAELDWSPKQITLEAGASRAISVIAKYSDGTTRDVSDMALYELNEDGIVTVDSTGQIKVVGDGGLAAVIVKYGQLAGTVQITVPYADEAAPSSELESRFKQLDAEFAGNTINQALLRQWRQLQIQPSEVCDDETFIRRVSLDISGTLPTAEQVTAFVNDTTSDKRARLIDRLLDTPEYASYFAQKWADILQNRGKGYSTSKQRPGTALFANWIRDSLLQNKPYDQFVTEILTATGSQAVNPPTVWYRSVRTPSNYVESVAQAFLGVRIQCAQCHHHPADRWSQADYFGFAANFARVGRKTGFADAEVPTAEVIYVKDEGDVFHPRTGELLKPKPLGDDAFNLSVFDDPRIALSRWMTQPDNPYFASTMANRMWSHFFSRGIIHPVDDRRSTNPPSNPELLDALAESFADSGFDIKHLIRTICNSHAYQLDSTPNQNNATDNKSFARFYPRRMAAEILLDAISQSLEVPTVFPGGPGQFPGGTRAIELPDENVAIAFLDVFGRPARFKACECERIDSPTLAQGLELVNSQQIQDKLAAETGFIQRLADNNVSHAINVNLVFLTLMGRLPIDAEKQVAIEYLDTVEDRAEAYRNLVWSLLATNEFMFIR
ncbi:MAG TPA: S-layer protein [Planctomycetaceae bacterium]|nr:S-layer protein [Planctomycetaceae bacterium]